MRKTAVFNLVLIIIACLCLNCHAVDEEYSFVLTDYTVPTSVRQSVDSKYRETGTTNHPVYYKYSRTAEKLTDDLFDSCYTYLCHGTGEEITNINHNMLTFNFALPTSSVEQNDTVYFSFWYRSNMTFTGRDSQSYTGTEQQPIIMFNSNNVNVYEVSSGNAELSAYVPDSTWHKVEYYVPLTSEVYVSDLGSIISNYQFRISFLNLNMAAEIQFAGMKCGVLKVNDGEAITEKKAATYLGKALTKGQISSLAINGTDIAVSDLFGEYNVSSDSVDEVDIVVQNKLKDGKIDILKNGISEYELHVYSPGYDLRMDDDEQRNYIKYVSDSGMFDESAEAKSYSVKNSDHYSVIKIYVDIKTVWAELAVNGNITNSLEGCVVGDKITLTEKYINVEKKDITYMSLVVLKKGNNIRALYPFKTVLAQSDTEKEVTFEVELTDNDYNGMTADFYIIDLLTNSDIIK